MIYTPRVCISMLEAFATHGKITNPTVCTKIEYKGFEISISMDSSHGAGDLARSDIRIYTVPGAIKATDCTSKFLEGNELMLYGDAATLLRVMKKIESMDSVERYLFIND